MFIAGLIATLTLATNALAMMPLKPVKIRYIYEFTLYKSYVARCLVTSLSLVHW